MLRNEHACLSPSDPVVCGVVVTLHQDVGRRQRAVAEIAAHPAIRVAAIKDRWLPLAIEARDESETHQIHHWITSLDGVDVADVVSLSRDADEQTVVNISQGDQA